MTRIELQNGKYIVQHDNGTNFKALRYGEGWRDLTGDGLVLTLVQKIEELGEELTEEFNRGLAEGYAMGTGRSLDYDE